MSGYKEKKKGRCQGNIAYEILPRCILLLIPLGFKMEKPKNSKRTNNTFKIKYKSSDKHTLFKKIFKYIIYTSFYFKFA